MSNATDTFLNEAEVSFGDIEIYDGEDGITVETLDAEELAAELRDCPECDTQPAEDGTSELCLEHRTEVAITLGALP